VDVSEVARFSTLPEGELAVALLRDHGIDAYLPDRQMATSMPHLHIAIGDIRVVAPRDQVLRARDILRQAREGGFTDDGDDGEWARDARADGGVGELDAHEIRGVIGSSRKAGVIVVVAIAVASLAGCLYAMAA
jgi:hypothetical protein